MRFLLLVALCLPPVLTPCAAAPTLPSLLDQAGLKYRLQDDGSAVLALQGKALHAIVIRPTERHTTVYCVLAKPSTADGSQASNGGQSLIELAKEAVPPAVWRVLAELNANPWLPRVAYVDRHFVVSVPLPQPIVTPPLLRDTIMAVGTVADVALPRILELLPAP